MRGVGETVQQTSAQAQAAAKHTTEQVAHRLQEAKVHAREMKEQAMKDPHFWRKVFATASGAASVGTVGGALGTIAGAAMGAAAGLVPAVFTFGLSIPAGAIIGGTSGLFLGSAAGGSAGGAAAFGAYQYRAYIQDGLSYVRSKTADATHATWARVNDVMSSVGNAAAATRARTTSTGVAVGGTLGCLAGGALGGLAGAALGVVPALFTFGLSIPVGGVIGLCAGAAAGSGAGAVGGGVAGYTGFAYHKELQASADYVKGKAYGAAHQVAETAKAMGGA